MLNAILLQLSLLLSIYSFPCESDIDCGIGSQCVKDSHSSGGICIETQPYYRKIEREELDLPRYIYGYSWRSANKTGSPCNYNSQCNRGRICRISTNSLYGICT